MAALQQFSAVAMLSADRRNAYSMPFICPASPCCGYLDTSSSAAAAFGGRHRRKQSLKPFCSATASANRSSRSIKAQNNSNAVSTVETTPTIDEAVAVVNENITLALRELENSLAALDEEFLSKLPKDLQVDVRDAGFAIGSGSLASECGEDAAEVLVQLGAAFEASNAASATSAASALILPATNLPYHSSSRAYLGKRLVAASRYLASTGSYGEGELARVAKALKAAGEAIAVGAKEEGTEAAGSPATRTLKFGSLQVNVTPTKAFIGAGFSAVFGILCWKLASSLQAVSEDSLNYANDNALALAVSLRGSLLAAFYSSALLSSVTTISLVVFGVQLSSSKESSDA